MFYSYLRGPQEDVPWEWDRLFTEVSSELLTEWESQERPETEKIGAWSDAPLARLNGIVFALNKLHCDR